MNRRSIMFAGIFTVMTPQVSWAGGHNKYCHYRDDVGAFLPENNIVVHGQEYERFRALAAMTTAHKTVLVENASQYRMALRDIRNGRLPSGSIAVYDKSNDPDIVLNELDRPIERIVVLYNIPESEAEFRAVHGRSELQRGLTEDELQDGDTIEYLRRVASRYKDIGASKIGSQGNTTAAAWLRNFIRQADRSTLIVIASHLISKTELRRSPDGTMVGYPGGLLPLTDGSVHSLADHDPAGPICWTIGCDTWALQSGFDQLPFPMLSTTELIQYADSLSIAAEIRDGRTVRELINRIQMREWRLRYPRKGEDPIPRRRSPTRNHLNPTRPDEAVTIVADNYVGPNIVSTHKTMVG